MKRWLRSALILNEKSGKLVAEVSRLCAGNRAGDEPPARSRCGFIVFLLGSRAISAVLPIHSCMKGLLELEYCVLPIFLSWSFTGTADLHYWPHCHHGGSRSSAAISRGNSRMAPIERSAATASDPSVEPASTSIAAPPTAASAMARLW